MNGGFGPWGQWSACSKSCGAGMRLRKRECNSPVPKFGGTVCSGNYVKKEICGNVPCSGSESYVQVSIIIMYIYHALINTLSAHMIHINLNMISIHMRSIVLPKQFT